MVDGNSLVLTYDETLGANTPVTSAYTVEQRAGSSGPWSAVTVDSVTVSTSAKTVTLALTSAVGVGDNVRVSYAKPATNKLTDAIGNEAAALANQTVTNSSARPTLTITGPTTETKDPFTVTFTFNKAVTGFAASDVTVTRGSKGAFTETTAAKVWTLVVTPAAGEDDNDVEVSVAQDAATNNGVGNAAASADFDVDTRPPALSTAAVDGSVLTLTYDETLGAATPVTSAYTVEQRAGSSGPWSAVTVDTVTVSGSKVTLALTSAVGVGDAVRVSYVKPGSNKLTDAIGNEAAALSNQAVSNNTAAPAGPTFNGANIPDQIWYLNTDIGTVQLPAATGGKAPLTYTLNSDLPEGVTFDNDRRQITGAPTEMRDPEDHTYTVTDANGNSASIRFKVIIQARNQATFCPTGVPAGSALPLPHRSTPSGLCVIRYGVLYDPEGWVRLAWNPVARNYYERGRDYQYRYKTTGDYGPWKDAASRLIRLARTDSVHVYVDYVVTGLTLDTTYTFQVRAPNGQESNEIQFQPRNHPAQGQPTISGTAQVGQTLTADASGISDQNGLLSVIYFHQWVRVKDGNEQDIPGARFITVEGQYDGLGRFSYYTPVAADVGATLKVKVGFNDNGDFWEELTSQATGPVAPASQSGAVPPPGAVPAPTGLSLGEAENGDIIVSWTSVPEATSYQYRYTVDGATTGPTEVPVAGTSLTLSGLDLTKAHTFQIYALRYDTWSGPASITFTPDQQPQEAQQTVSVSLSADSSVNEGQEATVTATLSSALGSDVDIPLTLTDVTSESTDYGTLASISITAGQTVGTGKIAANWDADTEADTFTVALDTANLPSSVTAGSPISASVTIQEVPAPDAVASVTVTHNGDSLTVSWPAAARATGYDVTYTNTDDETTGRGAWDHTGASLEITCDSRPDYQNRNCVVGSAAYTVGVRAKNANGESGWVNSAPARPPVPAPTGLSVSESGGDVTLSWNSVSIATSYQYKHTVDGTTTGPTAMPVAGTSLTLSGLDLTKAHTFQVYALWYDTWSEPSVPITWTPTISQAQESPPASEKTTTQQAQSASETGSRQKTADQTVTVTVTDANDAPAFTSSATKSVAENQTAVLTVTAEDSDVADSVSGYAVTGGADKDKFQITNAGVLTFQAAPDFENPTDVASASPANEAANNQYVLVLTATSGTDSRVLTATQTITVTVENANDPATGAPSISGAALVPGTLTAVTSGIADQDGLTAPGYNYQWLRVDGDSETNIGANSAAYTLAAEDQGKTVKVRVSFTDDAGNAETLTSAASGTIALPPAPTGLEVSESGGVVTLSWDSVDVATGYQYQYTTGGVTSVFILVPVDGTSFTISDLDLTKAHTFQVYTLYYDVRSGPSAAATLNPPQEAPQAVNAAPAFASAATFSVNENQTGAGTVVAADGDSEDSVSGYAVTGGADKDKFAITNAGALTFTTAPNFESPTDAASATPANDAANNQYVVTVRATSGTGTRLLTADQTIVVTVADANDAPTGKPAISGAEKVGETLTAGTSGINDEDGLTGSPSWTYQWQRVDGGAATDISGATGSSYVLADDDVGKKLRVTVSFTDDNANNHSLTSDDTAAIGAADGAG